MAHRYWRVRSLAQQDGGLYFALAELEMRATVAGADQCSGGVVSSSSDYNAGTNPRTNVFDNNTATWWASASSGPGVPWIAYDFVSPVDVVELSMTARNDAGYTQAPSQFVVEYSDDNVAWTLAWAVGSLVWTTGSNQIIAESSACVITKAFASAVLRHEFIDVVTKASSMAVMRPILKDTVTKAMAVAVMRLNLPDTITKASACAVMRIGAGNPGTDNRRMSLM